MIHKGRHTQSSGVSIVRVLLLIVLIAATAVGIYIIRTEKKYKEINDSYSDIADKYRVVDDNTASNAKPDSPTEEINESDSDVYFPVDVDFQSLINQDQNVCGWIYLDGTQIDYPVFHGTDNYYYLTHGMNGVDTGYGGIFLDAANIPDFSNSNSIVYGHHMQNGSFFASVCDYKKQEFYNQHPSLYLATPAQNYRADVYSCYITKADSDTYTIRFSDTDNFAAWLKMSVDNSLIATEVTPNLGSRILTLSTCSYEFDGARCVVHCILTEI